eukprot:COSAG01_NODE_3154_length_6492_cov_9.789301_5_plen_88_part_00
MNDAPWCWQLHQPPLMSWVWTPAVALRSQPFLAEPWRTAEPTLPFLLAELDGYAACSTGGHSARCVPPQVTKHAPSKSQLTKHAPPN